MENAPQGPSPDSLRVLSVLRDKSMNGYMLLSKSALQRDALLTSLRELTGQALVRASGEITVERMGESFFSIPMEALGYVDQLLGRVRRVQYR
jgi:hypothetical protein